MRPGDLKKLINFEKQTIVSDGMGGKTVTWATHTLNTWAAIWPVSAKETLQVGQETMTVSHKIRIRYRSDITAAMRIKYGTSYYNIVSIINPNMENRMLDILAKKST